MGLHGDRVDGFGHAKMAKFWERERWGRMGFSFSSLGYGWILLWLVWPIKSARFHVWFYLSMLSSLSLIRHLRGSISWQTLIHFILTYDYTRSNRFPVHSVHSCLPKASNAIESYVITHPEWLVNCSGVSIEASSPGDQLSLKLPSDLSRAWRLEPQPKAVASWFRCLICPHHQTRRHPLLASCFRWRAVGGSGCASL